MSGTVMTAITNAAVYRERLRPVVLVGVLLSLGGIALLMWGGGSLAATFLVIWLVILLVKDPRGVLKRTFTEKQKTA